MKRLNNNWKLLTIPFNTALLDALQQQHHAAQYIAMAGKHLIPRQSDDSNTNMEFEPDICMLVGNPLTNGIKVALHLDTLSLTILDQSDNEVKTLTLTGKTKNQGFTELQEALTSSGVDTGALKNVLHYEIPNHRLDNGATFSVSDINYLHETLLYRNNARLILQDVVEGIENAEPVKIWPHHFDTGSLVSYAKDEKGEHTKTIGLGLAIPDSMVEEPYYYLSFWVDNPKTEPDNFAPLNNGKWMMPEWNGAVLPLSDILQQTTASGQYQMVYTFFKDTFKTASAYLEKA